MSESDGSAMVTVDVGLVWTVMVDGAPMFQDTGGKPWTFRVEQAGFPDRGWKVCGFDAPDVCAYVLC